MKKKYRKYTVLSIILIALFFSIGIFIRYIIDPVGLNNKFNLGLFKDVGLGYRTQKFVELNEYKPETIIIGGSRVHYMQTEDVEKYTKDKVYNLGLPYSTMEEQYYFLKYSLENFKIKNVLIGINLYPFSSNAEENNSDFDKEIIENGFTIDKQIKHYLEIPLFKYFEYIYTSREDLKEPFFVKGSITPYQEARSLKSKWEERSEISYKGYLNKYKNNLNLNFDKSNQNLEYFKQMISLCKKYNVNYKVFSTVVHNKQLNILKEIGKTKEYYEWKREIAKITPYWDFMYNNEVSKDDNKFIDTSHIKHNYEILYLEKIFENKGIENFGLYMDENTIDKNIEILKLKNGW